MARRQRSKGTGTLFRRVEKGPWIASWYDYRGKRLERSTRTTDRAAAERILAKHVSDAALRRDGVIDPTMDRHATEGRRPIREHLDAYITHCRSAGQAKRHVDQKAKHLDRMIAGSGISRLSELTADALEKHLFALEQADLSARSINFARQISVAFFSWCVKTGRAQANPLKVVPKRDEQRARRRVRRPLTDQELAALLSVAKERGRVEWYLAAALAGLRKGDLQKLTWADIDFTEGTITIRHGKAKREDVVPLHPQLADALKARRSGRRATPAARVFPETVTDVTRLKDFLRAGIAREEVVKDAQGEPVMVGRGKRRRPKTRIVCSDDEGRVIDLHALRTTLGTQLARAGVAPQIAQRIMRHSDYRTTLRHYTVLGLQDTAQAVARLPGIEVPAERRATGTDGVGASPRPSTAVDHQLYSQQLARQRGSGAPRRRAGQDEDGGGVDDPDRDAKTCETAACDGSVRDGSREDGDTRGCSSVVERQLPKLNVEGSTPFTRFPMTLAVTC